MSQELIKFDALRAREVGETPPVFQPMRKRELHKKHPFLIFLRGHLLIILLGSIFLAGLIAGSIFVSRADAQTRQALEIILSEFMQQRQTQSFSAVLFSTFFSIFVLLLALFFCGFCTISQIIILLLPLFKGLGYGFSVGSVYLEYGISAFGYVAVMLVPTMLFSTLLLLYAAKTSFILSLRLFRSTMSQGEESGRMAAKRYCVKFIAYVVIAFVIALFDAMVVWQLGTLIVL